MKPLVEVFARKKVFFVTNTRTLRYTYRSRLNFSDEDLI